MKKVLSTVFVAGMLAFIACGPSADEKAADEKAAADSAAAAEQAVKAAAEQQTMQDSVNMMQNAATTDTTAKAQ